MYVLVIVTTTKKMAIFSSLALLISCIYPQKETVSGCQNSTECREYSSCISGVCIEVDCVSTYDCPLEEVCEEYSCIQGCYDDRDCLSGRRCDSGSCVDYSCRDTQLDCLIGEVCREEVCTPVDPSPCAKCTYLDWIEGMAPLQECVIHSFDTSLTCNWHDDTGCPDDMSCYPADGQGNVDEGVCIRSYGFHRCVNNEDCPRGFYCAQDIYANDSDVHVCWGDCVFFRQQGWL